MDKFVYKPIKVFKPDVLNPEGLTPESYLQYFKKEIIPYTTVNKFDGTYKRILESSESHDS